MSLRGSRSVAVALITFATFIDIVAYSVAVPVLPDLSHRLGASPTTIGLLFASFGVTLLFVSIPMGAMSDRAGRKGPLVGGLLVLAAASLIFAFARGLLNWKIQTRDFSKANSAGASPLRPGEWVRGIGTGSTATGCGARGNSRSLGSIRTTLW